MSITQWLGVDNESVTYPEKEDIMVRFFFLSLVAALSLTANAQWSGNHGWSGSSPNTGNAPVQNTVSNASYQLKDVMVQFPEGAVIQRTESGNELIWQYDGKQFVSRVPIQAFTDLIRMYAAGSAGATPVGTMNEWDYTYADTGNGIAYQAKSKTMKDVFVCGIAERGMIRNTDAYVRAILEKIKVGLPAAPVAQGNAQPGVAITITPATVPTQK